MNCLDLSICCLLVVVVVVVMCVFLRSVCVSCGSWPLYCRSNDNIFFYSRFDLSLGMHPSFGIGELKIMSVVSCTHVQTTPDTEQTSVANTGP